MSDPGQVPSLDDRESVALGVSAGGIVAFVLGWIVGSTFLRVLGLLGAGAGGALYARAKLTERNEKIDAAESQVRSALDDLDPVARAQVLADVVRHDA